MDADYLFIGGPLQGLKRVVRSSELECDRCVRLGTVYRFYKNVMVPETYTESQVVIAFTSYFNSSQHNDEIAFKKTHQKYTYNLLRTFIPDIRSTTKLWSCPHKPSPFPQCYVPRFDIMELVIHLNDGHKWTFDQIADHLETLPVDLTVRGS